MSLSRDESKQRSADPTFRTTDPAWSASAFELHVFQCGNVCVIGRRGGLLRNGRLFASLSNRNLSNGAEYCRGSFSRTIGKSPSHPPTRGSIMRADRPRNRHPPRRFSLARDPHTPDRSFPPRGIRSPSSRNCVKFHGELLNVLLRPSHTDITTFPRRCKSDL